jgi:hypothetical protein
MPISRPVKPARQQQSPALSPIDSGGFSDDV